MNDLSSSDVREFILRHLTDELRLQGRALPDDLPDDYDLMLSGLIDSLGLLELMSSLAEFCGRDLDFEALDPDEMTVLGPLSRFVADSAARV